MNEAKHTPGPWENEHTQYDERISFDELRPSWVNIIRASNVIIAETSHRDISLEEQEANAALIAAAPDLLEALKDCCVIAKPENPSSCCPVYRPGEHGGCAENEDGECHIWKAIQKARGQG